MDINSKQLIGIPQLADLLSVKQSWIRSHVFKKTIPHYKVNGLIRFERQEILHWLSKKKNS